MRLDFTSSDLILTATWSKSGWQLSSEHFDRSAFSAETCW